MNQGQYRKIYSCLDNSSHAMMAAQLGVEICKRQGAHFYGSHAYAAKLHDRRFRAMESGLPEPYQEENELERQRKIHDSLITKGLELITDSYLVHAKKQCESSGVGFQGVSLEGRNWQALLTDIEANDYDLVALGAQGLGKVPGALLGSVTERLLRRLRRDVLICRTAEQGKDESDVASESVECSDEIIVCLDGSERSWGALERGMELARAFEKRLVAISAFDPYFHYAVFGSLNEVLTTKARRVFKFEEQEKLHEDIIDTGLAKIYQSHLDIARRLGADQGCEIETHLLDGKAYEKILAFAAARKPWLLILGRTGIHSDEAMDIGGNTENVCRLAECNVLIVDRRARPPVAYCAEETVTWTKEALEVMDTVPDMARPVATRAIQVHCLAEGHTVVTRAVLDQAISEILPLEARQRMGIGVSGTADVGGADQGDDDASGIRLRYGCSKCTYTHAGRRPELCPLCGATGAEFSIIETQVVEDGVAMSALGGRELTWDGGALELLNGVEAGVRRDQLRAKLEKRALSQHVGSITVGMIEAELRSSDAFARKEEPMVVWTEEAVARLERVPAGFMRNAAKSTVISYAKARHQGEGPVEVTLEEAEGGLGEARKKMAGMSTQGSAPIGHPSSIERVEHSETAKAESLEWSDEAKARLATVPAGMMREMTRARVVEWARTNGHSEITLETMQEKYESWAEGSAGITRSLEWTEAALERIGRVPDFIRPRVAAEVERVAREQGKSSVDEGVLDGAMNLWQGAHTQFHGK